MDLHSFSIWNDYVQFLRGVEAAGSFAENQVCIIFFMLYFLFLFGNIYILFHYYNHYHHHHPRILSPIYHEYFRFLYLNSLICFNLLFIYFSENHCRTSCLSESRTDTDHRH